MQFVSHWLGHACIMHWNILWSSAWISSEYYARHCPDGFIIVLLNGSMRLMLHNCIHLLFKPPTYFIEYNPYIISLITMLFGNIFQQNEQQSLRLTPGILYFVYFCTGRLNLTTVHLLVFSPRFWPAFSSVSWACVRCLHGVSVLTTDSLSRFNRNTAILAHQYVSNEPLLNDSVDRFQKDIIWHNSTLYDLVFRSVTKL